MSPVFAVENVNLSTPHIRAIYTDVGGKVFLENIYSIALHILLHRFQGLEHYE